jgi:hypothetical protein
VVDEELEGSMYGLKEGHSEDPDQDMTVLSSAGRGASVNHGSSKQQHYESS